MRKNLIQFLSWLNLFLPWLLKKLQIKTNNDVVSLAPRILTNEKDIKLVQPYFQALKQAIDDPSISNIALTGAYGSGKSTIIKTFLSLNSNYKHLVISLASFKPYDIESKNDEIKEEKSIRKIEVSILQQIFYRVKPSNIPNSRFKRIRKISKVSEIFQALLFIIWVIVALNTYFNTYWQLLNPANWDSNLSIDIYAIFHLFYLVVGSVLIIKKIFQKYSNSKINKISIDGEVEIGGDTDKSVFNQHLEEILYFFESTDFDLVVFEDLDRFDNTMIFSKLREINTIINDSKSINRPVNFVYAIRDELFVDKSERVKFFDFIIPVISFINPSNAGDQFQALIRRLNLEESLSNDLVSDILTFISDIDMRLLTNIFIEYDIYKKVLPEKLEQDELFAMIVYKNLYPDDFGKLNRRSGKLYQLLSNKNRYVQEEIGKIESRINEIKSSIKDLEKESFSSIKELRRIYIHAFIEIQKNVDKIRIESEILDVSQLLEDEHFIKFSTQRDIKFDGYRPHNNSYHQIIINQSSGLSFKDIEKTIGHERSYQQREEDIKLKNENAIDNLKRTIQTFESQKEEIDNRSLRQIFESIDIDNYLDDFKKDPLVKNLVLNGYLNENYSHYTTLFHSETLTEEDYYFDRCVKSGTALKFNYELTEIEGLIKQIGLKYFGRKEILNFQLLDYLLENHAKYGAHIDKIIQSITKESERSNSFLSAIILQDFALKNRNFFFDLLAKKWTGLWNNIMSTTKLTSNDKEKALKLILENVDKDSILEFQNGTSEFSDFINQIKSPVTLFSSIGSDLSDILISLKLKLQNLTNPLDEKEKVIFEFVYTNRLYALNLSNLRVILNHFKIGYSDSQLYSTIVKTDLSELKDYVNEEIDLFVSNVLIKAFDSIDEEQECFINLINKTSKRLSNQLIKIQESKIEDISLIHSLNNKSELLKYIKVEPLWENILNYYNEIEEDEFDDSLITYLNNEVVYTSVSKEKIKLDKEFEKEQISSFCRNILYNSLLSQESFKELIKSIPFVYESFQFEECDEKRISSLIELKKITLSQANIESLKSVYPKLAISLFEYQQIPLKNNFKSLTIDNEDLMRIFESKAIDINVKSHLATLIDDSIVTSDKLVANRVAVVVADSNKLSISFSFVKSLIQSSISIIKKTMIANIYSSDFDDEELMEVVSLIGASYRRLFEKQNKPTFENNADNQKLMKELKQRRLIKNYSVEKKGKIRAIANYK